MVDQVFSTVPSATVTEVAAPVVGQAPASIYTASAGHIFWRNFLAGFSSALGAIVVYVIFLALMFIVFVQLIWPQVAPTFNTLMQSMQILQATQQQTQELLPLLNGPTAGQTPPTGTTGGYLPPANDQLDHLLQLYQNSPAVPAP